MQKEDESISRRAFVLGALGVGAVAALTACTVPGSAVAWTFEQDDGLPILCMRVAGGAIVAATADGWVACDGYIQLQLGGGSIPSVSIKAATSDDAGTLNVVLDPGDGISTRDLVWSEFRLVPPTGVDVAKISKVVVDYGGAAVELEELLPNDGSAAGEGRPVV